MKMGYMQIIRQYKKLFIIYYSVLTLVLCIYQLSGYFPDHHLQLQTQLPETHAHNHKVGCFLGEYCMEYIYRPTQMCIGSSPKLFIFVFSLASNQARRSLVRATWGSKSNFPEGVVQVVFLIGRERHRKLSVDLMEEVVSNNDIYIVDLMESFHNLTLKAVYGLHIASHFCPNAEYVMKTDDDMLVNIFELINLVNRNQPRDAIMGFVWHKSRVFRLGRYGVPRSVYTADYYPPFCSGSGYVMSIDLATVMFELAVHERNTAVPHLDDAYVTGILASRLGVKYIDLKRGYRVYKEAFTDARDGILFWHLHDEHSHTNKSKEQVHRELWSRIVARHEEYGI